MTDPKTVFLCWSGTRSERVAEALAAALERLGRGWVARRSPEIGKGRVWFEQILDDLGDADAAIVCLTPENVANPWIHFEAGAIASRIGRQRQPRVFPYLFRMTGIGLDGPLSQFQTTHATRGDTLRLVRDLLSEDQWLAWPEAEQNRWWVALEWDLREAEDRPLAEILPTIESLFRRKTFDEPLDECVNQAWLTRLLGAHDTHRTLKATVEAVSPQFRPYVGELLRQLEEAVDAYAMALELLLVPLSFELQDDGRREVPAGLLAACENRRQRVKVLACRLGDPAQIPVLEEALRFQELESFAEKKAMIHRFEGWLARQASGSSGAWRFARCCDDAATNSKWDFDRISFYLSRERGEDPPSFDDALDWLRKEFEKTRANCDASHMPLTYCLGPLRRALKGAGSDAGKVLGEPERAQLSEAQALLGMITALGSAREKQRDYPEPSRLRVEAESCLALLAKLRTR